jgi:hypothetical protein
MEDFPFNFNLSYQSEDYIVKPPTGLFQLKELITKKYNIEIENMVHIPENGEKMESGTHSDNIDAYLSLVIRADMELSEDPCVDKESSTYNRLLNARISEYLHASK